MQLKFRYWFVCPALLCVFELVVMNFCAVALVCRHEMQHFVQSVEGYLSNQVIQVSWKEFQVDLAEVC